METEIQANTESRIKIETTLTKTVIIQIENQTQAINRAANQVANQAVNQVAVKAVAAEAVRAEAEEKMLRL